MPLYSHSWDGQTYVTKDNQGMYGAVTFDSGRAVGFIFSRHSFPNSFPEGSPFYDPEPLLSGMPDDLRALGEAEAMQHIVWEYNGLTMPVYTAAFWSVDGRLVSADPWSEFMGHGGDLFERHFLDLKKAIREWKEDCLFSRDQMRVLRSLYERRMASMGEQVTVEPWEQDVILLHGGSHHTQMLEIIAAAHNMQPIDLPEEALDASEGTKWCREALACVGIVIPDTPVAGPGAEAMARRLGRQELEHAEGVWGIYDQQREKDAALIERLRAIAPVLPERIAAAAVPGMPMLGAALICGVAVIPYIGELLADDGNDPALQGLFSLIEALLGDSAENNQPIVAGLYDRLRHHPERLDRARGSMGPRSLQALAEIERLYARWHPPTN